MTKHQQDRNKTIMDRFKNHGTIEVGRVFVLADMAEHGVYPDESFNGDESNIWWLFRGLVAKTHRLR